MQDGGCASGCVCHDLSTVTTESPECCIGTIAAGIEDRTAFVRLSYFHFI